MAPPCANVQRMIETMNHFARMSWLGDDALLTPEHMAIILGVSTRGVANQRRAYRLPKAIRFGNLVRWRLSDMREQIQWKYDLAHEQVHSREAQVPRIPDNVMSFAYEHIAMALNCSVRTVGKLRAVGRLPPPFKQHPIVWRPSEIHLWVMSGCR